MNEIIIIKNVRCRLDSEGNPEFNLEDVARGLGFARTAASGNVVVRWETVRKYLEELGVPTCWHGDAPPIGNEGLPDFIPLNIVFKLCFKAENKIAIAFQNVVTDEILPAIYKHGVYATPKALEAMLEDPDTMIQALQALKAEQEKRKALEADNSRLTVENQIMAPKADYFDVLVDCNVLTGIRETAKELGVKQTIFVNLLLDGKYMYRDKKGKLQPYAQHVVNGLFELKECANEKTGWGGTQPFITPKGREMFMRLLQGISA